MIALSGVRSSWDMFARNSLLSRVARMQLDVLGHQRALVPPALLQHRGPVEPDDHLVAESLEQLQVVIPERPAVPPVVHADGADHHAARAERNYGAVVSGTASPGTW